MMAQKKAGLSLALLIFCLGEFHLFYFLIGTGSEQIQRWSLEYRMFIKRPKPVGGGEGKREWGEGEVQCGAGVTALSDTRCSSGRKMAKGWAFILPPDLALLMGHPGQAPSVQKGACSSA